MLTFSTLHTTAQITKCFCTMNYEELGEEIMNPVSFVFLELLPVYLTAALEG